MSTTQKKPFFFVLTKDYSYCVPWRDLKTVDAEAVKVGDEVSFKYCNMSLTGTVQFISGAEDEVLAEIRKEKKAARLRAKQDTSFHEGRPRKCALQGRELMKSQHGKASLNNKVKTEESEAGPSKDFKIGSKTVAKKVKDLKKAKAELSTELNMLADSRPSEVPGSKSGAVDDIEHGTEDNDSSSSIDAKQKGNGQATNRDIRMLKQLEDSSDNDVVSTKCAGSSERESSKCAVPAHSPPSRSTKREDSPHSPHATDAGSSVSKASSDKVLEFNCNLRNPVDPEDFDILSDTEELHTTQPISDLEETSPKLGNRKKKRKLSVSSSSSTSSSSSISTSSSSTSTSSDSSKQKHRKKRKHRRSKKSKKSRNSKKSRKGKKKRTKRIETDSSDSSSHHTRKHRGRPVVRRNLDIFPGKMYRYTEDTPGVEVVRVHSDYDVFISKKVLDDVLKEAKSVQLFIKSLVLNVFTKEALRGSTAQGFPNRVLGSSRLSQEDVLPRLDPEGREAIIKRAKELEEVKKSWRPRIGQSAISHAFTQAVKKCSA